MKLIKKVAIIGFATFALGSTVAFAAGDGAAPAAAAPAASTAVAAVPDCSKTATDKVKGGDDGVGPGKKAVDSTAGKTTE
jgi:hypothetical protein